MAWLERRYTVEGGGDIEGLADVAEGMRTIYVGPEAFHSSFDDD